MQKIRLRAGRSATTTASLRVLPAVIAGLYVPVHAADWEVSGQLRQEIAVKTTDDQNKANQYGNPANGLAVPNQGLFPAVDLTRPASIADKARFNAFTTRLEVNLDGKLSETLKATVKLRTLSEQVGVIDDVFKHASIYRQEFGGTAGGPLAWGDKKTSVDLPAAYIDYNQGPLWLRAGNQQIAWGEAIFFRVADVPNGLDYRNHLFDPAGEEYSDKRRSALGLRADYRVSEKFGVDGFAQRFAATLLPNPESPTNFITDQFTIHQKEGYDKVKNKWNFGLRARGDFNGIGYQAFAVSRYNPDGVYQWTDASGPGAIAGTAFEAGTTTGVYNHQEWYQSAARSRLNGIQGLDAALNFIPDPVTLGATGIATACGAAGTQTGNFNVGSQAAASCILDSFFGAFGNLRGHLIRDFKRETVLGFGVNKVFEGEPDSLLDQLIGRFELSYTPNKYFTNPTLGPYIKENETQFALIFEKYHKFVSSFPATYFVAQWLHKTKSDLFGRYLGGVDNTPGEVPRGQSGGFNALALALQQPSPTLEYRFDFAILTDTKGGWYAQPGLRWKPTKSIQADLYANIIAARKDKQKDFLDGQQHNNEVFARVGFFF